MTSVVAPYVPFYAASQPYITVAEFLSAPTGVDVSQLIPGAAAVQNQAALATLIRRASSDADTICQQVLAATSDLEVGEFRVQRGVLRIPVPNTPVVEVTGVSVGRAAGALTALTDLSGVWINRKVVTVPVPAVPCATLPGSLTAAARPGYLFAQVQYVNGFANTTLSADAAAGDSIVSVTSALGVFPGMPLTVLDDDVTAGSTEAVTVDASYVQGSVTVPLAAPLTAAHAAGTAVSAMPQAIKDAVVQLTAHRIKTRGAESITLQNVSGGPAKMQGKADSGATVELDEARRLLAQFARVR